MFKRLLEWMPLVQSLTMFLVVVILIGQQIDLVPTVMSRNMRHIEDLQQSIKDSQKSIEAVQSQIKIMQTDAANAKKLLDERTPRFNAWNE